MTYDFDQEIERRGTDSHKWRKYGDDVIPLWVADMDFVSAQPIIEALHKRVAHGVFGYTQAPRELSLVIQERLKRLYGWEVREEDIIFLPGVVSGLNLAFHVYAEPGDEVLVQPPVYSHFIRDPLLHGRAVIDQSLVEKGDTYEIDFDALDKPITDRTKLFILCNPHNPVGRVFATKELERLAEICLRHNIIICSDEIHCDLIYPGYRHVPIATLGPEVENQTVTLMAPSKTFNVPGLGCAFAIIKNETLRRMWISGSQGLIPHVNIMGLVAALAAYRDGQEWLDQVLFYLKGNRDFLMQHVREKLPRLRMKKMEATYLAWLDCRNAGISGNPFEYFLREARVALNDGADYGKGGAGFVRLNFACTRRRLTEALDHMAAALK
ncbi:MAG TPA: PatB family C-S lyase [Syntrophorhabdales bacterium]|nr:PatB family C-S lyase [Syntrophorhabdales bacterium]